MVSFGQLFIGHYTGRGSTSNLTNFRHADCIKGRATCGPLNAPSRPFLPPHTTAENWLSSNIEYLTREAARRVPADSPASVIPWAAI